MSVSPTVAAVFGHFQNLNLLALIQDLRDGRTARQAWAHGAVLCPVAHGLPGEVQFRALQVFGPVSDLCEDCDYAARHLGANPTDVLRFVEAWDGGDLSTTSLLRQLDEVWNERLADAEAVQAVIGGGRRVTTGPGGIPCG